MNAKRLHEREKRYRIINLPASVRPLVRPGVVYMAQVVKGRMRLVEEVERPKEGQECR